MRPTDTLRQALSAIVTEMGYALPEKTVIEPPRDSKHGDLSTNVAMLLAKEAKTNPRELAQNIAAKLPQACADIAHAEAAGPGFCNVTFAPSFWQNLVPAILEQKEHFGESQMGGKRKVLVEYVSANPTGPLHVGHGRGAAVGDSITRLLRKAGYEVDTEYYINDAGRQMRLLGLSVWLRAKELQGLPVTLPEDFYRGEYIIDIAREMLDKNPKLCEQDDASGEDECYEYAMNLIMDGIKDDMNTFRVEHKRFFSEKSLVTDKAVDRAFAALTEAGYTYDKDDAYWFATSGLGDDKDRVLKKSDGYLTYFATDIAYHHNKFERGYEWLIDVWGADHHGYIPRMRAAITAMGREQKSFDVVLIQLVNLLRNGEPVSMSTRAGTFETLHDVVAEVGTDAARFMFLSRKCDSTLDFDLEAVKARNMENPVYYVQYGHARVCAVLARAAERGITLPEQLDAATLALLDTPEDLALLRKASTYTDMLENAARTLGVHHVSHYLSELAGQLHSYYGKHQVLVVDDTPRTLARLALMRAIGQVLANGLDILGVSAPERM